MPAATDRTYRLLVAAAVDYAIFALDTEGRITTWDAGAARLKGYAADEAIGQSFAIFFTEEDRRLGRPAAILAKAAREGRTETEGWRVRKDGSRFWALAVLDAMRDGEGKLIGFAKITRDITDRHAAELELRASERRFRLLVDGVTDYAIFGLDPSGRVTNWNSGASRIKGYTAEEITGQHFSVFYTPEDRAAGAPDRALAVATATGRYESEGWRLRKNGERFWANAVIDAIRDEDGALVGFAKVTRDMTERRQTQQALDEMRERLAQSQRLEALGQLTGGIAHDFNNLLQVMSSGIAAAARLTVGDERVGRILEQMRTAITRGTAVTRQLLVFGRQAPLSMEVVESEATVRAAVELFKRSLRRNIALELDIAPGLPPVRLDETQFEMALLNIAINARDAMPEGGRLTVRARLRELHGDPDGLTGAFLAVSLADTGAGIPPEVASRVFEPFFTTKPVGQGTGLGLSQVYGFARQCGGTVTLLSRSGEGTEVTLLLPVAAEEQGTDATPPAEAAAVQRDDCGVLVVDDDAVIAGMTAEMLSDAGCPATSVTDPRQALRWLEDGKRFRLVVSDVMMPGGMSGLELGREIRRRWPGLPVLLATGYSAEGESIGLEFPLLRKPYSAEELAHAVERLTSGHA